MHCFYEPDLSNEYIHLSEEESKHAVRVLRLSAGDQVIIVDGRGTRALAEVENHRTQSGNNGQKFQVAYCSGSYKKY
jgi:16S rRNA U1498 N3-methylase RsmE